MHRQNKTKQFAIELKKLDVDHNGSLKHTDLKKALDNVKYAMSDKQFNILKACLGFTSRGEFNIYQLFELLYGPKDAAYLD